ncbi:glycine zipper 2TM domain-containing protein [Roseateles chitosanitabidus]|jgi:outer membrane lipoprotein SlyB|uniref:glycine zipper 2TM domain-containing protein n=1 Tax=Roseateles chitosanitabidus TaxID=65048 RepID=UPI0009FDFB35|nr:glycine zipper 2TM domain-containing protein [Roseateles chitosanitabidus]MBO9688415.1 glycine zipper 2TM domain-containing protein [Roseateles chitosanitabidus]
MALTTNHKIAAGAVGAAVLVVAAFFAGRHQSAPSVPDAPLSAMTQPEDGKANVVDRNGANSADEARAAKRAANEAVERRQVAQRSRDDSGAAGNGAGYGDGSSGVAREESRLCSSCATVLSVRTEAREGQGSGIGVVGGAVVGGLLGSAIGGGTGRKIATVGGAVAGGYAGNEIEKRQRSTTVWVVKMRNADQSNRTMTFSHDPGVQNGDIVRVSDGQLIRQ